MPNPKLPGPQAGILDRRERNGGCTAWYGLSEPHKHGQTDEQESERLHSTEEAGELLSAGPRGGKEDVVSSNRWGKHAGGIEL